MKKLITALLTVLAIGENADVKAQGFDDYGYTYVRFLKSSTGTCEVGKLVKVTSYFGGKSSFCVDPESWIKTQNGGRIQHYFKSIHRKGIQIESGGTEVNCVAMESRLRPIFDFTTYKPTIYGAAKDKDGWWVIRYGPHWDNWEVMEREGDIKKYVCNRWRRESS